MMPAASMEGVHAAGPSDRGGAMGPGRSAAHTGPGGAALCRDVVACSNGHPLRLRTIPWMTCAEREFS